MQNRFIDRFMFSGYFKVMALCFFRIISRLLWIFPMKRNRVFFHSFLGKNYNCNPKYISEELLRRYGENIQIIWGVIEPKKYNYLKEKGYIVVKRYSLKGIYYEITSKVSINNFGSFSWLPLRKGQHHINTWHGGGSYKCTGKNEKQINKGRLLSNQLTQKETTEFISSCKKFSDYEVINSFGYEGTILNIGMPRNDIFFDEDKYEQISLKIRNYYNIPINSFIVMYAPTFREETVGEHEFKNITPSVDNIIEAVKQKYNKDVAIIIRSHHLSGKICADGIDVSDYDDMQELLLASDMVITDYSSLIWDYSFTYRPCFLFTPDLEEYQASRGLFDDIYSWGFPVCKSDAELSRAIINFDENDFKNKMDKHHQDSGSYEDGNATKVFCDYVDKWINE